MLQRDFEADGGLTPLPEEKALDLRRRAIDAVSAVFEELGLAKPGESMKQSVTVASGSDDTESFMPRDVAFISGAIREKAISEKGLAKT